MSFDSLAAGSFGADMFERFAWLREHDPIHWDEKNELFVVSRCEDVFQVSKQREIFCSGEGVRPGVPTRISIGNHFCLGANLARMELRVVFEEVLRRLPDMEYAAGPPRLEPSALVRSFVSMPVRYSPERRAA